MTIYWRREQIKERAHALRYAGVNWVQHQFFGRSTDRLVRQARVRADWRVRDRAWVPYSRSVI